MSQAGNSAGQSPLFQSMGCFLGAFVGFGGMMIIGLLIAGYTWQQIKNDEINLFEEQAPEMQQPVGELPSEENPAPALEDESVPPGEVDIADIAGSYVGTTNFKDQRVEDWGGGAITENEIAITISEDGNVTGTFLVRFESSEKSNEHCAWETIETESGVISGQLPESTGIINFDYTSTLELLREDLSGLCALDEDATTVTEHQREFTINISGNVMTGNGGGNKTFEATKQ